MATLNELLGEVSTVDKTLVISNDFRTINIPSSVPNLGVEYDDDVLRLDFKMPRYVSDTDLSKFAIRINYMNAQRETDTYTVSDALVGNEYITFSWLVGPTATRYKGDTKFIVCAKTINADGTVDREFNTTIATLPVLEGLEVDESVVTEYSDIIEQWRQELFGIGDTEEASIKAVSEAEQKAIENKGAEVLATIPEDYQIAVNMTDNADRTKADAIVCSTQSETIVVTDSSDDHLRGLKLFGKTTQVTTTGKNLLNVDENLSFTGLREKTVHIPAGTYVLTWLSRTNAGQNKPVIRFANNGILIDLLADRGNSKVTLTQDETTIYIYSNGYDYSASENVTATITQLMLSVDGGEYEPYSGGLVSPSPAWSQTLNNLCDDGTVNINICGRNLLDFAGIIGENYTNTLNGLTVTVKDGFATTIGTNTKDGFTNILHATTIPPDKKVILPAGTYTTHPRLRVSVAGKVTNSWANLCGTFEFAEPFTITGFYIAYGANEIVNESVPLMLIAGTGVPTVYESFKPYQNISLSVDNGLSGIPVTENGIYTDLNGQQWICDEVDFERGLYIKRIGSKVFDGSTDEIWYADSLILDNTIMFRIQIDDAVNIGNIVGKDYLCSNFAVKNMYNSDVEGTQHTMKQFYFRLNKSALATTDLDGFREYLNAHPMTVQYVLADPIITPLTAEEKERFRFAHTNFPNTTVLNDAGATMELVYNADTKLWMDNLPKVTDEQAGPLVEAWFNEHYDNVNGVVYGKSAYEIALERGFQGSEEAWLTSLKGRDAHTPVKGIEYYTAEERDELLEDTINGVTPESIGAVPRTEAGNKIDAEELFLESSSTYTNRYINREHKRVNHENCSVYVFNIEFYENRHAMGETLKIKTYMHGDMAVCYTDSETGDKIALTNDNADAENPESCIFECEIPVKDNYGTKSLSVSCLDNPYFEEPEVIIKTTIWDSVGKALYRIANLNIYADELADEKTSVDEVYEILDGEYCFYPGFVKDTVAHIDNVENPHEVTPEQIGAATQEEIGSKEDAFALSLTDLAVTVGDGRYIKEDCNTILQDGCRVYNIQFNCDVNAELMGKTLKVKTYMYGNMAIRCEDWLAVEIGAESPITFTNQNTIIDEDPKSGIYECEIPIKGEETEIELYISFCENPYLDEPIISIAHDTVWEEIAKLVEYSEQLTPDQIGAMPAIEHSRFPGCYYRLLDPVNEYMEWINPPMMVGVEYRTTERSEGKPVYAKRITYAPDAGGKLGDRTAEAGIEVTIPHNITNHDYLVRCTARAGRWPLPEIATWGGSIHIHQMLSDAITIMFYKEETVQTLWIDLYYTKTE